MATPTLDDIFNAPPPNAPSLDQIFSSPQEPSMLDQAGRQVGLATRDIAEGNPYTALPLMAGDALNTGINYGIRGINNAANTHIPEFGMPSQTYSQALTDIGLPVPQTDIEKGVNNAATVMAGAGGSIKAGLDLAKSSSPITQKIGEILATAPKAQMTSAAASSGASDIAKENGASPALQMASGLTAGVIAPWSADTAYNIGSGATRLSSSLLQPFTETGRNKIVGNALNRMASNPANALDNLKNYPSFVNGSIPTSGVASGDYGMLAAERGLRNTAPANFADIASSQNNARNDVINNIAQDPQALAAAITNRKDITDQLRETAFSNGAPVNVAPITEHITNLAKNPDNAGETVQKALNWANNLVSDKTDPRALYAARKDIGFAMDGKLSGDRADFSLARKQLVSIKDAIDAQLEQSSSGFGAYLDQYKSLSKPINQMEIGQDIVQRTQLAAPDINGSPILSQAKYKNVVGNNQADLHKIFTPDQMQDLNNVGSDLNRAATINNAAIKPTGSDTLQNLTTAHLIGKALGGNTDVTPLTQSLARPLSYLYKIPEHDVQDKLVEAMSHPAIAAALMSKASTPQNMSIAKALQARLMGYPLGASLGQLQTTTQN